MVDMEQELIELIENAEEIANEMKDGYVGSEHILLAILNRKEDALSELLHSYGMDYYTIREDLEKCYQRKINGKVMFTRTVETIFELSYIHACDDGRNMACILDLEYALLHYGYSTAYELLLEYEIEINEIEKGLAMKNTITELGKIKELTNLNLKMENSKQEILCREQELEKLMMILLRKEKSNPLLIGEPGTGKSALVEELARRISQGEITPLLRNVVIYELNINSVVAGTKYRGEFEEKIEHICSTLKRYHDAIVFIDEIHQIVGAGKAEGSIDVATVFKPYLARNDIRVIGATTINEYAKYIEKDRALDRRFQTIVLEEPTVISVKPMIQNKIKMLCAYHGIKIEDSEINYAIKMADEYLLTRHFPDKAIDVIDLALTKAKLEKEKLVTKKKINEVIDDLCNRHYIHPNFEMLEKKYDSYMPTLQRLKEETNQFAYKVDALPVAIWNFSCESIIEGNTFVDDLQAIFKTQTIKLPMQLYNEPNSLYQLTSAKDSIFYKPWEELRKGTCFVFELLNFDEAHNDVKKFFYNIFENGKWKNCDGIVFDFRHTIFLITTRNTSFHSVGFNETKVTTNHSYFEKTYVLPKLTKNEYLEIAKKELDHYDLEISQELLENAYENHQFNNIQSFIRQVLEKSVKKAKFISYDEKNMVK